MAPIKNAAALSAAAFDMPVLMPGGSRRLLALEGRFLVAQDVGAQRNADASGDQQAHRHGTRVAEEEGVVACVYHSIDSLESIVARESYRGHAP